MEIVTYFVVGVVVASYFWIMWKRDGHNVDKRTIFMIGLLWPISVVLYIISIFSSNKSRD